MSDHGPTIDWAAALAEHGRWLRVVVRARVRDAHEVEEVMQEVALAAVAQSSPIRDHAAVGPWLRRLAVRQALLHRRGRGRGRRLIGRHADRLPVRDGSSGETDPLDWILSAERSAMVRAALGRLPARDAEILMLKYLDDWSYREMAERLGLTESAVEARLHRARSRLRAELAADRVIEVTR